jgi:hypothetical protein
MCFLWSWGGGEFMSLLKMNFRIKRDIRFKKHKIDYMHWGMKGTISIWVLIFSLPLVFGRKRTYFTTVHGFVVHGMSHLNVVHTEKYKVLVFHSNAAGLRTYLWRRVSVYVSVTFRYWKILLGPVRTNSWRIPTWLFAKKKKGPFGSHWVYCRTWRELNFQHEREEMLHWTWCMRAFLRIQNYFTATSFNRTMSVFSFQIIIANYIMRSLITFTL